MFSYFSPKNSPFNKELDVFFQRIKEAGLMDVYLQWARFMYKLEPWLVEEEIEEIMISMETIDVVFYLYLFMISIATLVFLLELVFHRYKLIK